MLKKLTHHPIWALFREKGKKNVLLFTFMFFFNLLAALMEGISFTFLLFGLSFLAGEFSYKAFIPEFIVNLGSPHQVFLCFTLSAIGLQILKSLFSYCGQLITSFLTVNLQSDAQESIYRQIFRMSYPSVSVYKLGDLAEYASAPPRFFPHVMDSLNRVLISVLMIMGYLCLMFLISVPLTFFLLGLFALTSLLQRSMLKKITHASTLQSDHLVELGKETVQNLNGLKLIHLFSRQEALLKKIRLLLKHIAYSTFKLTRWNHFITPVNEILGIVLAAFALVFGSKFLQGGSFPLISTLLTFLTLTYRLATRLQITMTSLGMIASNLGPILRMENILNDEGKEFLPTVGQKEIHYQQRLDFENVTFAYPSKKREVLHKFCLTLEKGKTVALVGTSGSGKTTAIDLLLRLYEPNSGTISLDGRDSRSFDLASWRSLFGVVNQDSFLFHETIKENIRFGNLQATNEGIIKASELAGAHDFISQLPEGYQTVLGEKGYKLSGGERQRISLARALIRDPEILVLDEATSNLDSRSEYFIQRAMETLKKSKTLLIIAHRLSTITMADEILVLEKGSIIERGNHHELLQLKGKYHFFWNLQAKAKEEVSQEISV